jgi:hypothetical protein
MKKETLDCPYDFTSRCTMGRCDCKPKQRLEKYSERFDNDKSEIGNPETWGKRVVEEPKQERSYSEEEVIKLLIYCKDRFGGSGLEDYTHDDEVKEWFEKFKNK